MFLKKIRKNYCTVRRLDFVRRIRKNNGVNINSFISEYYTEELGQRLDITELDIFDVQMSKGWEPISAETYDVLAAELIELYGPKMYRYFRNSIHQYDDEIFS